MINEVTMFDATCDGCGEQWIGRNDYCAHYDKSDTVEGLSESEWVTGADVGEDPDRCYCPECFVRDEEDKVHIRPKNTQSPAGGSPASAL